MKVGHFVKLPGFKFIVLYYYNNISLLRYLPTQFFYFTRYHNIFRKVPTYLSTVLNGKMWLIQYT